MSTNPSSEVYVSSVASLPETPAASDLSQDELFESCPSEYTFVPAQDRLVGEGFGTSEIRTVIAGPEAADRNFLQQLLESEPGILLFECRDTDVEAVVRKNNPDLVVIDMRTLDAKGPEWFNDGVEGGKPVVLCVASDPQYASRAFELNAVDFLVRPFDRTRFRQAMERVRRELGKLHQNRLAQEMMGLLRQSRAQERPEQLVFRANGRLIFVDLDEIDWISASANYVQVNVGAESYQVRESIGRLSARLDGERFVRIHRSVIVNVRRIKELQSCNSGEYIAILKNGKKLPCSRGYRGELERYISSCMRTASPGR